jgi:hypothetical protein
MRNRHVLVFLGNFVAAAVFLIQPSIVLAAGVQSVANIPVSAGDTKIIPATAINSASRVAYVCNTGGYARIKIGTDKSKATFTCGEDPKAGEIDFPDKTETMTLQRGVFCSRP